MLLCANNGINKSEAGSVDDWTDSKYLMCLFHYSVSRLVWGGGTVTVSAVLAVRSMVLKRNSEDIHSGDTVQGCFLLTCILGSR